jgi:hypothetical protein
MALIYQATNKINGKRYIGVAATTLKARRSQHFAHAKARPWKQPFLRAIVKYGERSFSWKVLERHAHYDDALAAEVRLIAALKPEYNVTAGGRGIKGIKRSPAWIAQWNARRHVGPEASSRAVVCLDDGMQYASASAAARAYGAAKSSVIEMCQGISKRRSVNGRRFRYLTPTSAERRLCEERDVLPKRKLYPHQVVEIRTRLLVESAGGIARFFGVSRTTIFDIKSGRTWTGGDHGLAA